MKYLTFFTVVIAALLATLPVFGYKKFAGLWYKTKHLPRRL
jgi:hypothetical protein